MNYDSLQEECIYTEKGQPKLSDVRNTIVHQHKNSTLKVTVLLRQFTKIKDRGIWYVSANTICYIIGTWLQNGCTYTKSNKSRSVNMFASPLV